MRIAVCLFARNEERDIAEWLAFQFATGFDACLVYDNGSADRTPEIVLAFGRHYDARLINWPEAEVLAQVRSYQDCLSKFGSEFDWIAFIDADELIVPNCGTISDILEPKINVAAVAVNWSIFGSSGVVGRQPGLMSTTFTRRSEVTFAPNNHVKSIVRPNLAKRPTTPHSFEVAGTYQSACGGPVEWANAGGTTTPSYATAKIHHYFTRSRVEWERKVARGYRDGTKRCYGQFSFYDRNEVEDWGAARFSQAVWTILGEMGEASRPYYRGGAPGSSARFDLPQATQDAGAIIPSQE